MFRKKKPSIFEVNFPSIDQLTSDTAPDFSNPVGLLLACHEKLRRHCQLLVDLCSYLESHTPDKNAQTACENINRYFSVSAIHHHQDEEQDLFPLLLASPKLTQDITELIGKLKLDHFEMDKYWLKFEPLLKNNDLVTLAIMTNQARRFQYGYEQHISLENNFLLPVVEKLLTDEQIHMLGQNMKARRQS